MGKLSDNEAKWVMVGMSVIGYEQEKVTTQRTHGVIMTLLLRQNDVVTSFSRNNNVIIIIIKLSDNEAKWVMVGMSVIGYEQEKVTTQRTHGVIMTLLLRQNDVVTSFSRNNNVIITPRAPLARFRPWVMEFLEAIQYLWSKCVQHFLRWWRYILFPHGRKWPIYHTEPIPWKLISSQSWSSLLMYIIPWWRHQMETFSALLALCAGNSPVNSTKASNAELWCFLWSAPEQTVG